jgi:hypothetical protein
MYDIQIAALLRSPTVTHEPEFSTAYKNGEPFSAESLMSLALATIHENNGFQRSIPAFFAIAPFSHTTARLDVIEKSPVMRSIVPVIRSWGLGES